MHCEAGYLFACGKCTYARKVVWMYPSGHIRSITVQGSASRILPLHTIITRHGFPNTPLYAPIPRPLPSTPTKLSSAVLESVQNDALDLFIIGNCLIYD